MNCREVRRAVHAFIDGELDAKQVLDVESHLETCRDCSQAVEFERWFKTELRQSVGAVFAPAHLQDRIHVALVRANRADFVRAALPRGGAYAALAAGVAAALFLPGWLASSADELPPDRTPDRPVIDYVAERHARWLPVEVTGPDPTSVARWYQDKLDFAVHPPSFQGEDVRLVGGRISNVGDRQAAQLVYQHRDRRITVIVFDGSGLPMEGARPVQARDRTIYLGESRGYPVAVWQDGGVAYAASSDLSRGDFFRLVSNVD